MKVEFDLGHESRDGAKGTVRQEAIRDMEFWDLRGRLMTQWLLLLGYG